MKSGFRIEVSPKSKLGKQLTSLSVYLRNSSNASGIVKLKIRIYDKAAGMIVGRWTVRPSGAISFKGKSVVFGDIEYVYGKLTIGHFLDKPGHQICLDHGKTIKLMSSFIEQMYPYAGADLTDKNLNAKLTRKEVM